MTPRFRKFVVLILTLNIMNKTFLLILSFVLVIACGKEENGGDFSTPTTEEGVSDASSDTIQIVVKGSTKILI